MNYPPPLPPLKASAYFSLISFLQSESVPSHLLSSLKQFIDEKYSMRLLNASEFQTQPIFSCDDLIRQWSFFNKQPLESLMSEHLHLKEAEAVKESIQKQLKEKLVEKVRPWFQKKERKKMKNERFPKEIFVHHFQKLKNVFGHKSLDEDFEDYDYLTSPIYNLLYDKTGKIIVTADDDGVIKLWSSETGALLSTLKSHKALINSLDISPCNRYLASCSNDGSIRVWDFLERKPLAVLRENINEKLLILFFYTFENLNRDRSETTKLLLICASEEGNIYIYDSVDFLQNNGIYLPKQKLTMLESPFMQLYDFPSSKGICSIDFHPHGFLAVGTQLGDIVIFDSVKRLRQFGGNDLTLKTVMWNDHKKTCHLTVWAKDGLKLISASFDGTAKIWLLPEGTTHETENRLKMRASADFTIFFDETKAHDAKCWAVNWSCNSHYAMASFSRKSRKKNESGKLISTIQVYDSWCNRLIQKIDSNSVPIELNQFIYIIEPHPFKDNIAFTADYDGKVVLWDIEQGLILNIFFERGSFFNSPTLELPCLDGRFSPDGFSFSVATYYGTFSIYGYGVRDPYDYTPIEQFYLTDHKRFEFDEIMRIIDSSTGLEEDSKGNGKLCNILRNEYPKQPRNIMDILMKNGYFRSNFGQSGLEGFEKLTLENEENNSSCNNFILEKEETNVGELAGDIEQEYENLLFFQHQNENHRLLLEKPLEEIESNRVSILEKQKKIILTSLASHLSQHILPILNPGSLPKNSLIQAKNLSKLKEITHGSDENDSPRDEGQVRRDSRPPLRRLLRRNSPIRGVAVINELTTANLQMRDFDDPEDENWELDSSVSLDFKPKRVNTRNRTSTRPSQGTQRESGYDKNGIKTRGIKKKVQLNDDDSDYKANGILRSESEEDYDSSQEDRKRNGNREGLRNKENHKRYRDRSDEEEFKEFDDGLKENNQKPKFKKQQVTKRKERNFIENEDHLDFEPPCEKKTKLNKNFEWTHVLQFYKPTSNNTQYLSRSRLPATRTKETIPFNLKHLNCSRCGLPNAQIKCSSLQCSLAYHDCCGTLRGLEKDDHHFYCFECWFQRKKPISGIEIQPPEVSRLWLDIDEQMERHYVPQVGDKVYFFFQGYEEFLREFWEVIEFKNQNEILPFVQWRKLMEPCLCEVTTVEFEFPVIRNKKVLRKWENNISLLMKLGMKEIELGFEFQVHYCVGDNIHSFLVLKDIFEYSKELLKNLETNQTINYFKNFQEHSAQILEISPTETAFIETYWKMVKITGIDEEGYNLRNPGKKILRNEFPYSKTPERINIWDILSYSSSKGLKKIDFSIFKQGITEQRSKEIRIFIEEYARKNEEIVQPFVEKVDFQTYPSYPFIVPFEMNLNKVFLRLENSFYRNEEALKQDIHLIQINCFLFNDPKKAVICDYVKEVTDSIIAFLEGKTKQIMASNSLNNNNYSNRNKKLNEKRKKDVIEEEEEDKSDKNNSIIITRSKKLNHKN